MCWNQQCIQAGPIDLISISNPTPRAGALVTIIGKNFGEPVSSSFIRLNGTMVNAVTNWNEWSDTKIVFMVPAGTLSGFIQVIRQTNASNTLTITITPKQRFEGNTSYFIKLILGNANCFGRTEHLLLYELRRSTFLCMGF